MCKQTRRQAGQRAALGMQRRVGAGRSTKLWDDAVEWVARRCVFHASSRRIAPLPCPETPATTWISVCAARAIAWNSTSFPRPWRVVCIGTCLAPPKRAMSHHAAECRRLYVYKENAFHNKALRPLPSHPSTAWPRLLSPAAARRISVSPRKPHRRGSTR